MLVAQLLLAVGFLVFLVYPAMVTVLLRVTNGRTPPVSRATGGGRMMGLGLGRSARIPSGCTSGCGSTAHGRRRDRGASAIEWVIITGMLVALAAAVGVIIYRIVTHAGRGDHHSRRPRWRRRWRWRRAVTARAGGACCEGIEGRARRARDVHPDPDARHLRDRAVRPVLVRQRGGRGRCAGGRQGCPGGGGTSAAIAEAESRGYDYATAIGGEGLTDVDVTVVALPGTQEVRVTVTGRSVEIVAGLAPRVRAVVQGPIEVFRPDD